MIPLMLALTPVFSQSARQKAVDLTLKGLELNDNSDRELNFYQEAIKADPSYAQAYYNAGSLFFDRKDYAKAAEFFTLAAGRAKTDPDIWYNLGLAHYLQKDYAASALALQTLIQVSPKDHEGLYLLSRIYFLTESRTGHNAALKYLQQIVSETRDEKLKSKASKLLEALEKKMKLRK